MGEGCRDAEEWREQKYNRRKWSEGGRIRAGNEMSRRPLPVFPWQTKEDVMLVCLGRRSCTVREGKREKRGRGRERRGGEEEREEGVRKRGREGDTKGERVREK